MRQIALLSFFLLAGALSAQEDSEDINAVLRKEIIVMRNKDQWMRKEYIDSGMSEELQRQLKQLDQSHTVKLKAIIHTYGWPGIKIVGEDGSEAMWLLVQHTPDKNFQKAALEKLRIAVMKKDASPVNLAYLEDRVLMNEGKMQIYGTQWVEKDGKHYLYPVENFGLLNIRRFGLGLGSIEEYRKSYMELYKLNDDDVVIDH